MKSKLFIFLCISIIGISVFVIAQGGNSAVIDLGSGVKNFFFEVAQGNVGGVSSIHKFGHNEIVGGSFETIWEQGGKYVYLTSASILNLSSSSASDTLAGTGARNVTIYGLDENYTEIEETLNLNGQTPVSSTKEFLRIWRMKIRSAGSNGEAVGDVYAGTGTTTAGVPTNVYAKVTIGHGQTLMAIYTIPTGKTGYIVEYGAGTNKDKETRMRLIARPIGEVWQVKNVDVLFQNIFHHPHTQPEIFLEKTDIEMEGQVTVGSADITSYFDITLVDN